MCLKLRLFWFLSLFLFAGNVWAAVPAAGPVTPAPEKPFKLERKLERRLRVMAVLMPGKSRLSVKAATNMATAATLCGALTIISILLLRVMPFFLIISLILAVFALVFGIIAKKNPGIDAAAKKRANVGIVIGGIYVGLGLLLLIILLGIKNGSYTH